jgi:hypothetical protein
MESSHGVVWMSHFNDTLYEVVYGTVVIIETASWVKD